MQHTSISPTVATTDTLRDLLGLCGTVVSAYVRRDEMSHLIRWLSQPLFEQAGEDEIARSREFSTARGGAQHVSDQIEQARSRMLAGLQPEGVQDWRPSEESALCTPSQTSVAAFATPDAVQIVPIPFSVEFSVRVGTTATLSPLLRIFGPEYAVGLRLSDRSARLITTFPSALESTPHRSATYTLHVSEVPPLASSRSSKLSGIRPLIRWLRGVDDEMSAFLPRRDQPVVLLGEPSLCDAFATLNLHRKLLRSAHHDEPASVEPIATLNTRIRKQASAFRKAQADADLRILRHLHAYRPERFCADDHVIATEAASRRIETLFVDENLVCERKRRPALAHADAEASGDGAVTGTVPSVSVRPQTSLSARIDRTVAETIVAGGTVHTVRSTRLPLGNHIAAIFRY